MRERPELDSVDIEILRVLAEDCSVTVKEIAGRVGVSAPSVRRRLRRLKSLGILRGCRAQVDPEAAGAVSYLIIVEGKGVRRASTVYEEYPEVERMYTSTSRGTAVLVARVTRPQRLDEIVKALEGLGLTVRSTMLVDVEHSDRAWVPAEPGSGVVLKCAFCHQPIMGEPYTVELGDGRVLYFNSERCARAYFLLDENGGTGA